MTTKSATSRRNGRIQDTLLVALLPLTFLVVSTAFLAGFDVASWQFGVGLSIWIGLAAFLHRSLSWSRLLLWVCLILVGARLSLTLCQGFYDLFYDSRSYQATGFLRLAEGWNPVWDWGCCPVDAAGPSPAHPLLAESYPKAAWILYALLIDLTGSLQSAFLVHLLALAAACLLSWRWLELEWSERGPGLRLLACACLALNPIALSQLFSHYVDGLVASILLCWFLAGWLFLRGRETPYLIQSLLLVPLALNLKFTLVAYLPVLSLTLVLAAGQWSRREGKPAKTGSRRLAAVTLPVRWLALSLAAGLLGLLIWGWNPYVSNTLRHGNPLYPAVGYEESESAVADAADPSFTRRNIFSKVLIANFSVASPADPRKPEWAWPLRLDYQPGVDHRFSGFGPCFEVLLLLALLVLLLEILPGLIRKGQVFAPGHRRLAFLVAGILLSVLITDAGWWARLAPQLWWFPIVVAIGARRLWARRLAVGLLGLALLDLGLVAYYTLGNQYRLSRVFARELDEPARGFVIDPNPGLFAFYSRHLIEEKRPDLKPVPACPEGTQPREIEFLEGLLLCR